MRKISKLILSGLCFIVLLAGCVANTEKKAVEKPKEEAEKVKKLNVYASFYPMYDFAMKIGGDKVEVKNMTPAGTEPHDFEPSTTDMKGLSTADVFIYNGDDMEHWVKSALKSVDNKNLEVVKASTPIQLQKTKDDKMDPHTWLSIRNSIKEIAVIKDAFIKKDPTNKEYYEKNHEAYRKKLEDLEATYSKELANHKGKPIVVAHEAFGYLCKDYDLKQIAIDGLSPDSEPNPAKMKEIIKQVKDNKISVIFYEELVDPKVAKTIADETGAKAMELNTLEGLSKDELKEGKDYISVMKDNLKNLVYALENKS